MPDHTPESRAAAEEIHGAEGKRYLGEALVYELKPEDSKSGNGITYKDLWEGRWLLKKQRTKLHKRIADLEQREAELVGALELAARALTDIADPRSERPYETTLDRAYEDWALEALRNVRAALSPTHDNPVLAEVARLREALQRLRGIIGIHLGGFGGHQTNWQEELQAADRALASTTPAPDYATNIRREGWRQGIELAIEIAHTFTQGEPTSGCPGPLYWAGLIACAKAIEAALRAEAGKEQKS
ncbi:MAG TPA: hypothetical protein VN442_21735 [Bryobacteraceae bacterium]|nr:hypothetical protein [Bryobacteraceae bacterium]